jgi:cytochrome bd-type quinol oxidase subunit 2
MTTRNAITAGLIWGSLLRASLYGVLLGAAFGGLYGAAGGTLIFPLIGTVVGLFFGALSGAVVRLPLGVLDGVLLSWLAVRYSSHDRPNARRYRARAGIVCAVGSLLALVADWALHDLPDPNDFATDRASHLVLDLFLPLTEQGSRVPTDAVILIVWVFVPLLLILCASWLNGVFVAGWHAGRVRHPRPPDRGV